MAETADTIAKCETRNDTPSENHFVPLETNQGEACLEAFSQVAYATATKEANELLPINNEHTTESLNIKTENPLDDRIGHSGQDSFTLTSALPPWEYLLDHCNKSSDKNNEKELKNHSSDDCDKLSSLLNTIDNVLERLKSMISDTCSVMTVTENKGNQSTSFRKDDEIILSDRMSILLGPEANDNQSKLRLLPSNKLNVEFLRCSSVIDSVVELFTLMENDGYNDSEINGLNPVEHIKDDGSEYAYEEQGIKRKTTKRRKRSAKQKENKRIKSEVEESDLEEKLDLEGNENDDKTTISSIEFSPEFCITKEEYFKILDEGKPYTCPPCQRKFNGRRSFRRHLMSKCVGEPVEHLKATWKKENDMFTCLASGCGKAWKRKETLYSHHQKEHLRGVECPFKCDKCEKTFYMRGLLNTHIKEDHVTTFCELCGKGVKGKLKLHMMRHTGDKPHKCQYCDYSAISSGQVKNHTTLMHENHKLPLHFCDICGKDFKLKGHLKEHILTHSDKRTYLCKICGKYLKNPNSYRRHMVSVHKVSHRYEQILTCTLILLGKIMHLCNLFTLYFYILRTTS